jgi:hypothetical protein
VSSMLPGRAQIGEYVDPATYTPCGCGKSCWRCTANFGAGVASYPLQPPKVLSLGASPPFGQQTGYGLGPPAGRTPLVEAAPEAEDGQSEAPPLDGGLLLGASLDGVGVAAFEMFLPGLEMDVYFSAGPRNSTTFGCSMRITRDADAPAVCSLYRLRIRPSGLSSLSGGLASVWRIKHYSEGNRDRFQPSVRDTGATVTLAYAMRLVDERSRGAIVAKSLTVPGRPAVRVTTFDGASNNPDKKTGGLQFPAFYSNVLTWSVKAVSGGTSSTDEWAIQEAQLKLSSGSIGAGAVRTVLGGSSGVTERRNQVSGQRVAATFEDADRQFRRNAGSQDDDRVMTMHSRSTDSTAAEAVPIVSRLRPSTAALEYEPFNLGVRADGSSIRTCQHPAWSPDDEIACHDHDGYRRGSSSLLFRSQVVYRKEAASLTWGPDGSAAGGAVAVPLVNHQSSRSILEQFSKPLRRAGLAARSFADVELIAFKYAQFCDDPDYVVATLMVADSTDYVNAKRGVSRVVLLRRSDGRIWDLTRLVEAHEGVAVGTYGAMMPTASSPSVA